MSTSPGMSLNERVFTGPEGVTAEIRLPAVFSSARILRGVFDSEDRARSAMRAVLEHDASPCSQGFSEEAA
mgnify:CR=1 FL=1